MATDQQRGFFRQVMPIMLACALTWSVGSMTNFMLSPTEEASRRMTHQRQQRRTEVIDIPELKTEVIDLPELDTSQQETETYRQVHFIDIDQLNIGDMFSATWIQPLQLFMKMKIDTINTVEDGCFKAFWPHLRKVRMTLDWLDFSVEHMSKWWKILNVFDEDDGTPFNRAVTSFEAYSRKAKMDVHKLSPLRETFAVIPFQPYTDWRNKENERAKPLTASSLAATIASLVNVGFGRVVVVGRNDEDRNIVQETFRYLKGTLETDIDRSWIDTLPVTKIGPMEVGFVQVRDHEVKSKFIQSNIPKGAIDILQKAFKGDLDQNRTQELLGTATDVSYWKYIFLTEPDTILQTKPSALPQLRQALDEGLILSPHRLQPIPHEADMIGMKDKSRFIAATGNFSTVVDLDANAVCCNEHAKKYKPWQDYFESCGTFWWECGFKKAGSNHSHLSPYSLIRLEQGTGIVSLAATEHGRRCFPKKNGACVPPGKSSSISRVRN